MAFVPPRDSGLTSQLASTNSQSPRQPHARGVLLALGILCAGLANSGEEAGPLSERRDIFVRDYRIEGNTVLSPLSISEVLETHVGRGVSAQELLVLRERLTLLYVEAGYVNSGFVIPEQNVADGIVRLQAIEGVLDGTEIRGLDRLPESFIRERIDDNARPFNMLDLQEQLQLLLKDPRIERINSELKPGIAPGHAWLLLTVTEARPWNVTLILDNHRPPSIGSTEGRIRFNHFNLTGRADEFIYDLGVTEGLTDLVMAYAYPVAPNTQLGIGFQINNATVIEEPFDQIDIASVTNDLGVNLNHVFVNSLDRKVTGRIVLEKRHGETELLNIPFSFAPGVENGKSDVSVLRFQVDWQERRPGQVLAAQLQISQGLDAFGATENPGSVPDSDFTTFLGQIQYLRSVLGDSQLRLRGAGQLALDPLLPIEKFVIGGADTVRGYRQNQFVRDNGWFVSAELQMPLLRKYGINWAAFADYGRAWNEQPFRIPGNRTLSSVGLGLVWQGTPGWYGQLYWGYALDDVSEPSDHDLQDDGITFLITWTL